MNCLALNTRLLAFDATYRYIYLVCSQVGPGRPDLATDTFAVAIRPCGTIYPILHYAVYHTRTTVSSLGI